MRKVALLIIVIVSISTAFANPKNFEGIASYYGSYFHGKKTASGELYNQYKLTAAHKTLPLGTVVKVTNLENHKSVFVKINDRGPYIKGRVIDVSTKAADLLGFKQKGTAKVAVEVVEPEAVPDNLLTESELLTASKKVVSDGEKNKEDFPEMDTSAKNSQPVSTPVSNVLKVPDEGILSKQDSLTLKATAGYFGIDLGSFHNLAELMDIIKQLLKEYQQPVYYNQVVSENNIPVYKLYMGNYKNRAFADALQSKLAVTFEKSAVVQW